MNKILLIATREFKNRAQKKSFLLATILVPLIFPAIIGTLIYVAIQQEKNAAKEVILYIDKSTLFKPDTSKFIFREFHGNVKEATDAFKLDDSFGLLYIPDINLYKPEGITLYTKVSPGPNDVDNIRHMLEGQIKEAKMYQLHINQQVLDSLNTRISVETIKLNNESGTQESVNTDVLFGAGMACGILMYMFIFIYGAQIMHGVIEEKSSKVVEIIVSSVRPFQLMMGKITGLACVGLLQFTIWIILVTTLSTLVFSWFGLDMSQQEMMQHMGPQGAVMQNENLAEFMNIWNQIPFTYLIFCFIFYFIGGYLMYGALFAAVGSSVDSPSEAQQFMFPITIPLFTSYMALFTIILQDRGDGPISFWLSIIPFTSPIAMMGRIAFGVPAWQLILSMVLLIGGFIFTTWVAGRIYRVGILMHGTKVNYKVLAKWFLMKN